jgi:hypothetical protein
MSSGTETNPRYDHRGAAAAAAVAADADAAATSSVIATLRRKLRHQDILEHPDVSRELRRLEEQLTAQLTEPGRVSGRHRVTPMPSSCEPGPERSPRAEGGYIACGIAADLRAGDREDLGAVHGAHHLPGPSRDSGLEQQAVEVDAFVP